LSLVRLRNPQKTEEWLESLFEHGDTIPAKAPG